MDSVVEAFLEASLAWLALMVTAFIERGMLASAIATTAARATRPTLSLER